MKSFSGRADIGIRELDGDAIYSIRSDKGQDWAVLIMIFAKAMKIQIKVSIDENSMTAFMIKNEYLKNYVGKLAFQVDFIKEYCNMVAGGIKQNLEDISAALSDDEDSYKLTVPLERFQVGSGMGQTPMTFDNQKDAVEFMHRWQITSEDSCILISVLTSITDKKMLHLIANVDVSKILITDDGSVEFF